jgi:DNA-binding CsgD family transcriptional regulator
VRVGAGIIHRAARENPECYALVMAAAVQPGAAAIASIARVWNHFFPDTPARFVPILPTARFDIVISPGDTEMRIDLIDGVARGWVTAYLDHVGARGVSVTPVSAEAAPGVWTLQCRFALPLERRRLAVEHALAWLARNTDLLTGNGLTGGGYRVASSPIDAAGRTTASALTFPTTRPVALGCHDLTRRELEIVDLISEGLANAAIATRLGIAESTVKKHINRIFRKTGYQSRYELIICRPFPVTPAEPSP